MKKNIIKLVALASLICTASAAYDMGHAELKGKSVYQLKELVVAKANAGIAGDIALIDADLVAGAAAHTYFDSQKAKAVALVRQYLDNVIPDGNVVAGAQMIIAAGNVMVDGANQANPSANTSAAIKLAILTALNNTTLAEAVGHDASAAVPPGGAANKGKPRVYGNLFAGIQSALGLRVASIVTAFSPAGALNDALIPHDGVTCLANGGPSVIATVDAAGFAPLPASHTTAHLIAGIQGVIGHCLD